MARRNVCRGLAIAKIPSLRGRSRRIVLKRNGRQIRDRKTKISRRRRADRDRGLRRAGARCIRNGQRSRVRARCRVNDRWARRRRGARRAAGEAPSARRGVRGALIAELDRKRSAARRRRRRKSSRRRRDDRDGLRSRRNAAAVRNGQNGLINAVICISMAWRNGARRLAVAKIPALRGGILR